MSWLYIRVKWLVLWSLWAGRLLPQPTVPVPVRVGGGGGGSWLRGTIAPDGGHAQYTGVPYAKVVERFKVRTRNRNTYNIRKRNKRHVLSNAFDIFGRRRSLHHKVT